MPDLDLVGTAIRSSRPGDKHQAKVFAAYISVLAEVSNGVVGAWGPYVVNSYCRADFNREGVVNGGDLGLFLLEIESIPQYCQ